MDNIKLDLKGDTDRLFNWINLAQDRNQCRAVVNAVMSLRGSINCGEFLG